MDADYPSTRVDGFELGMFVSYEDCGDAWVRTPDGSVAGLIWETGEPAYSKVSKLPNQARRGTYAVQLPLPLTIDQAAAAYLAALLPTSVRGGRSGSNSSRTERTAERTLIGRSVRPEASANVLAVSSPHILLREYLDARGLDMPEGTSARKVAEEAIELVEECGRETPDRAKVMHELADVVFAATVVAEHYGFTLAEAMQSKIDLDAGREQRG